MGIEGKLHIELTCNGSNVTHAAIRSSRPPDAGCLLEGTHVEQALQRLPRIFTLCATAQAEAALEACEEALSLSPAPAHKQARNMLVEVESAREHLLRILLEWPSLTGEAIEREKLPPLMQLLPKMSRALYGETTPFQLGSLPMVDCDAVAHHIADLRTLIAGLVDDEALTSHSRFEQWLERGATLPARLLRQLRREGWSRLGHGETTFLPPLERERLHNRLTAGETNAFVARPTWNHAPRETTPLQRRQAHPLVRELAANEGNGLLTRMTALLVELAAIPDRLQKNLGELPLTATTTSDKGLSSGIGLAQVEAARGRLIHRVEIEENTIRRYQILAPTEWNFHPQGVAARGLYTLNGNNEEELKRQAALWINTIDPCVGFTLEVHCGA